ncbi:MAG: hypothetical protein JW881_00360 [Spirochaetales bacterium]|nr:hypothetical protein [Spirochaetales bacterium]
MNRSNRYNRTRYHISFGGLVFFLLAVAFTGWSDNADPWPISRDDSPLYTEFPVCCFPWSGDTVLLSTISGSMLFHPEASGDASPVPSQLAQRTAIRPPAERIAGVRFWNWINIGLLTTNIASIVMVAVFSDSEAGMYSGIGCMASHELFAVSSLITGVSYYHLRQSMYAYENEKPLPDLGMYLSFASFVSAALSINIGAMLFGENFNENIMIVTLSFAGIANLCGIGSVVYTFIYDNTSYRTP